jgi:heme-degrading monooxygenase HmoA
VLHAVSGASLCVTELQETWRYSIVLVTVFRSRLNPETLDEFQMWAAEMSALVMEIPGYISHKSFIAKDDERVTIVEFESNEALQAWSRHPRHVEAKQKGKSLFFQDYRIQICQVLTDTADMPAP